MCATEISVTSDQQEIKTGLKMNVVQSDMNLLSGEYVSICNNDTLHIGATYQDLGPEYWKRCNLAGSPFQIETPLKVVYHYHYTRIPFGRGAFLKIAGNYILFINYIHYP